MITDHTSVPHCRNNTTARDGPRRSGLTGSSTRTQWAVPTFMRKNVMLVRRSTVDLRSWSLAGSDAGNVFYNNPYTNTSPAIY